jgi:serine/threonine-protein kinase
MMDPQNASPYPPAGETLDGKYRIEKLLGEGGMGAVARATHLLLHRTVAVKFMNPQFMSFPGAVERFLNEGRASGAIRSDHVVPVSDVGCLPTGTPYLVMECLYGLDLADLLVRDGPSGLPVERAVHFVVQILRGLQAAHAIGIIHRDMKPSNCFVVNHDGEDDFVKILDFGISKIAQPGSASLTQTNSALGTPLYMSPEQARSPRDVDARSDLYSVGVILYELLSGHTPFFSESGEFTEILFKLFTADPPPIKETRPDLPDALAVVVHKALAREVPDRYASAVDFADALAPFASRKTNDLIEKIRIYQPPSMKSVAPLENLPNSLEAFSQLHKRGTDVMVNRPTTDVQAGPPVTAVLQPPAATPGMAPPKNVTEVLRQQPQAPKLVEASQSSAQASAVRTDLGASSDIEAPPPARSPLIFVFPVVALILIVGIGGVAVRYVNASKASAAATQAPTATTAPPTAITVSAPPPAVSSLAPQGAAETASAAPSAAPSASVSVTATSPGPGPKKPAGGTTAQKIVNTGIHE